jgi:hypothetical protein
MTYNKPITWRHSIWPQESKKRRKVTYILPDDVQSNGRPLLADACNNYIFGSVQEAENVSQQFWDE